MKLSHFTLLIGIGLLAFAGLTRWQDLQEKPLIMTDGQGYHAYLPAVLIYHDLQFSFVDSINAQYYPEDKRARFIHSGPVGNVNKYFAGTALMQAPFFLAGCMLSSLVGVPVDGYAWPFQLMVGVAAICYLILGLWLLGRTLLTMGFGKVETLATVAVLLFGTNLFYYTIYEPSMSHVYSFCTVAAFVYAVLRAVQDGRYQYWLFAALALGLTVLIRPTNGVIALAVPAIAGSGLNALTAIESLFRRRRLAVLSVLVFVAVVSLQVIIYLVQTGRPIVWSYADEGFNFTSPELFNVLFSYRKGLFVYSPILLLAVAGMVSGVVKGRSRHGWLLVFLAVVTWIISSWWMWFYGGCFGQRAFIEYLPFFGLGLAFAFRYGWGFLRPWLFLVSAALLVVLQMVQTYQYTHHILPFDNMTASKYRDLFLRTGQDLAWYHGGYAGQDSYRATDSLLVRHDMENELGWVNEQQLTTEIGYSGNRSACMEPTDRYGITLRKPVPELTFSPNVLRVGCWTRSDSKTTDLALVCSLEDSTGTAYFWKKRPLRPQFRGRDRWAWTTALFKCGLPRDTTDSFVIYALKSDEATVCMDDMEISFIHAR